MEDQDILNPHFHQAASALWSSYHHKRVYSCAYSILFKNLSQGYIEQKNRRLFIDSGLA
jgi:hypothetical protein